MKSVMNKGILFLLICLVLLPSAVYAHGMLLELEDPGVLRAEYDDGGGFSPRTEVTIYDENGNELDKGLVDEEGRFHFEKSLDLHRAVAEDGMGHRAEYKKGS
ncbi:MAG: hypothetical protein WDA24_12420 [Tissierellales bacterium]